MYSGSFINLTVVISLTFKCLVNSASQQIYSNTPQLVYRKRSRLIVSSNNMKKTKLEINVKQLLKHCENMAKDNAIDDNWRLQKYVETLGIMLSELKSGLDKPSKETITDYTKRYSFLKGLVQTSSLNNSVEKVVAVQQLPHGAATSGDSATKEIHQKLTAKYGSELRSDLFGPESDDTLRQRNIIKTANFTSNNASTEDLDTLLKYHQNMQEKVAENMLLLTKSLKEQSQIASTIIKRDTEVLKKSTDLTDKNVISLKKEYESLQEHSKSAWKCWLWIMIALVMVIFINMVFFMKIMKKKL